MKLISISCFLLRQKNPPPMFLVSLKQFLRAKSLEPTETNSNNNNVPLYMKTPLALALTMSEPSSLSSFKGLVSNLYTSFLRVSFLPFKKGDYIRTQGHEGVVQDIDFMYLKLLRRDKAYVFIPTPSVYKSIIEVFK